VFVAAAYFLYALAHCSVLFAICNLPLVKTTPHAAGGNNKQGEILFNY
jgi:hypothetical protein